MSAAEQTPTSTTLTLAKALNAGLRAGLAGDAKVLVASGATIGALPSLSKLSSGVIVGTALRANGRPGGPIDEGCARSFAKAFRAAFG